MGLDEVTKKIERLAQKHKECLLRCYYLGVEISNLQRLKESMEDEN